MGKVTCESPKFPSGRKRHRRRSAHLLKPQEGCSRATSFPTILNYLPARKLSGRPAISGLVGNLAPPTKLQNAVDIRGGARIAQGSVFRVLYWVGMGLHCHSVLPVLT